LASRHRTRLVAYEPEYIVDGLGPLNPELAISRYPELTPWLARYRERERLPTAIIYQRVR
jgi:hypothetical protein